MTETAAIAKFACPACGGEAVWNPAKQKLVCPFCGIESPFDLLGLYSGIDLARKSVSDVATVPDMVFLYRRPILDYWAEHEESLGAIITHVLVHEIGHHFGLSDDDMERIEAEAVG